MTKRRKTGDGSVSVVSENPYAPLSDLSESEDDDVQGAEGGDSSKVKAPGARKSKVPKIFVDGYFNNHKTTLEALKQALEAPFSTKFGNGRTTLQVNSIKDFEKAKEFLTNRAYRFFTHTPSELKPLHMVMKGIPPSVSPEDVEEDLRTLNFNVLKVTPFIKKEGGVETTLSTMSIHFDKGTQASLVYKIRAICHCCVTWEKYKNKSKIMQCFKCLKFGHISVNCEREQRCLKCAGYHSVKDCIVEDVVKCANCGEEHVATTKSCPKYPKVDTEKTKKEERKKPPNPPTTPGSNKPDRKGLYSQKVIGESTSRGNQPSTSHTHGASQSSATIGECLTDMKSLFKEFNIQKIIGALKTIKERINKSSSTLDKIATVLEVLFEFFD